MELPPEQENVAGVVSPHQHLAVIINCIHQIILKLHIKIPPNYEIVRSVHQWLMCLSSAPYAAMDCWICSFADSFIK